VFPQFKTNPLTRRQIKLPKIGKVLINLHRPIPEGFDIKQVRVVKKASGWYAQLILQCDVQVPDVLPHGEAIGIDLGLEKFLAVSDGKLVNRPCFFGDLQSKLKWLQRRLRNKKKGSANYRKAQAKIRLLHEQIHNARKEFHLQTAHQLCDDVGMIFAEDLNLKMTSRGMLAKHCLDAAWGAFLDILKWVAWKRGVFFAKVDPNGTSQTCPNCGAHTGKKELSQRVHECGECGYITHRDVASAQVVMQRGLVAVGQTVILPVEEGCLGTPMKQECSKATLRSPHHNL
jgi:putative transposase